jgi:ABC-type lipoprotein export system ATPase subunit
MRQDAETNIIVETVQLFRTYHVGSLEVPALRGIDLQVPKGSLVALMGRSGSGKTTLLNMIGGLDQPTSGSVIVEGKDISTLSEAEVTELRRRHIGFVFQSFALIPTFSAFENVELPLRIAGIEPKKRRERMRECLGMVGLLKWADHRPWEMSGGQQQRVAIARALANEPLIMLADEPTGELDTATGREILDLFKGIVTESGVTIILATHDPVIEEYASVVHELKDGQIVGSLTPQSQV